MGLTRPKIWDIDTNVEYFVDPITVLHQAATQANVDVGFLFNRANGLVSNVALYWSEANQSFITAFTSNSGVTNTNVAISSYANLSVGNINTAGNIYANTAGTTTTVANLVTTNGIFWANGVAWSSTSSGGSTTGNTNPSIYLGQTTATTAPTLIDTIPVTGNTRVSWYTTSTDAINNQYRVSTIDSINNGTTVNYNEYGVLLSNVGTTVATFTSNISSGNINLWATGNSASVAVTFKRTVLGSATTSGYLSSVGPQGATGPAGSVANTSSWIVTTNTATSTSTTTGALQVAGGAGIAGNIVYGSASVLDSSSSTTGIGTSPTAIDTFATAVYRGAKYVISTTDVTNSQYQMAEVILTQDGTNVGISVYGVSYTGTSARMTFTASITSGTLTLYGTGVSANNTVKLTRTLIPV